DLHFIKDLILIFLFLHFHDLFSLVGYNRYLDVEVFNTFLVDDINLCFLQFFLWGWWFFHFLIFLDHRRSKLFHLHFRRLHFWWRRRRRWRYHLGLFLLDLSQVHLLDLLFAFSFVIECTCEYRAQ